MTEFCVCLVFMLQTQVKLVKIMTTFAVDSKGKRIKTDILVSGWIRNIAKQNKLLIPQDINGICFEYWLLKECDHWDKSRLAINTEIDEQIVKLRCIGDKQASTFGCHSIDKGSYEWKIKFISDVQWCCIGIIEDTQEILKTYQNDNDYHYRNGGFILSVNGHFYGNTNRAYCAPFSKQGTIITIKLNMDERTLSYMVNDKDLGIAMRDIPKKAYRFALTMYYADCVIELL